MNTVNAEGYLLLSVEQMLNAISSPEVSFGAVLDAVALSRDTIERVRNAMDNHDELDGCNVIAFGSLARFELTKSSDLDYLVVTSRNDKDSIAQQVYKLVNSAVADDMHLDEPGSSGIFGFGIDPGAFENNIGLEEDSNTNLTRRILLIEESISLNDPVGHEAILRAVINKYVQRSESKTIPRFLLNDIIRYWRTIAVDYQAKSESDNPKPLRYLKLLISRKICYLASLAPLYFLDKYRSEIDNANEYLVNFYSQPAIHRFVALLFELVNTTAGPDRNRIAACAASVLGTVDDFIKSSGNAEWRQRVQIEGKEADRKESSTFGTMRTAGKQMHSDLGEILTHTDYKDFLREYVIM